MCDHDGRNRARVFASDELMRSSIHSLETWLRVYTVTISLLTDTTSMRAVQCKWNIRRLRSRSTCTIKERTAAVENAVFDTHSTIDWFSSQTCILYRYAQNSTDQREIYSTLVPTISFDAALCAWRITMYLSRYSFDGLHQTNFPSPCIPPIVISRHNLKNIYI